MSVTTMAMSPAVGAGLRRLAIISFSRSQRGLKYSAMRRHATKPAPSTTASATQPCTRLITQARFSGGAGTQASQVALDPGADTQPWWTRRGAAGRQRGWEGCQHKV
jgi:hypothetical protein